MFFLLFRVDSAPMFTRAKHTSPAEGTHLVPAPIHLDLSPVYLSNYLAAALGTFKENIQQ